MSLESNSSNIELLSVSQIDADLTTLIINKAVPEAFKKYFSELRNFKENELTEQQIYNISISSKESTSDQLSFFSFRSKRNPLIRSTRDNILWKISKQTPRIGKKTPNFSGYIFIGETLDSNELDSNELDISESNKSAFLSKYGNPNITISSRDPLEAILSELMIDPETTAQLWQMANVPKDQIDTTRLAYELYNLIIPEEFHERKIFLSNKPTDGLIFFKHWKPEITPYNDLTELNP
ncbi:MAG TPA: hypothetical protein VLG12_05395 [Candidatus Saccharimonadales bacterium]|nr:hypothetical protein [Candidatus Saccharimonadales bacterium]